MHVETMSSPMQIDSDSDDSVIDEGDYDEGGSANGQGGEIGLYSPRYNNGADYDQYRMNKFQHRKMCCDICLYPEEIDCWQDLDDNHVRQEISTIIRPNTSADSYQKFRQVYNIIVSKQKFKFDDYGKLTHPIILSSMLMQNRVKVLDPLVNYLHTLPFDIRSSLVRFVYRSSPYAFIQCASIEAFCGIMELAMRLDKFHHLGINIAAACECARNGNYRDLAASTYKMMYKGDTRLQEAIEQCLGTCNGPLIQIKTHVVIRYKATNGFTAVENYNENGIIAQEDFAEYYADWIREGRIISTVPPLNTYCNNVDKIDHPDCAVCGCQRIFYRDDIPPYGISNHDERYSACVHCESIIRTSLPYGEIAMYLEISDIHTRYSDFMVLLDSNCGPDVVNKHPILSKIRSIWSHDPGRLSTWNR
jgi:hypothetical protein